MSKKKYTINQYGIGGTIGNLIGKGLNFIPGGQMLAPIASDLLSRVGDSIDGTEYAPNQFYNANGTTTAIQGNSGGNGMDFLTKAAELGLKLGTGDLPVPNFKYGGKVPVEIEGGEYVETPEGNMSLAQGASHEEGGIKVNLRKGAFVFPAHMKDRVEESRGNRAKLGTLKQEVVQEKKRYMISDVGVPKMQYGGGIEDELNKFRTTNYQDAQNAYAQDKVNYAPDPSTLFNPQNPSVYGTPSPANPNTPYVAPQPKSGKEGDGAGWKALFRAGQAAPTAFNLYKGLQGYDRVNPELGSSNFGNEVRNLQYDINPQLQQARQVMNASRANLNYNSANRATVNANMANLDAMDIENRNKLISQKRNIEAGYRMAGNQMLQQNDQFNVGQKVYAQDAEARNKAARDNFLAAGFEGGSQLLTDIAIDKQLADMDEASMQNLLKMFPATGKHEENDVYSAMRSIIENRLLLGKGNKKNSK